MPPRKPSLQSRLSPLVLMLVSTACTLGPSVVSPTLSSSATAATVRPTSVQTTIEPAMATSSASAASRATVTTATPTASAIAAAATDPLTGLAVQDPTLLDFRPLAIVVSNYPRSGRPQAGLSQADLVFEAYSEAGSSRFLAIYYGHSAAKVGPVRSARLEAVRIAPLYDAILVHVQAYQEVWDQLYISQVDSINEFPSGCPAICRDPRVKVGVDSTFGNTEALDQFAQKVNMEIGRPNLSGMVFDAAWPSGGSPGAGLLVKFSSAALAQWKYDAGSGQYLRFSESDAGTLVPLADRTTNNQLSVANVIVLYVPFSYFAGGTTSAEMWDVSFADGGNAVFFRDGLAVPGTWKRPGATRPLQFLDAAGRPYALKPGLSWTELIGRTSLTAPSPDLWHFDMRFP